MNVTASMLSCDPHYRALVRAALCGDATALFACSDYRQERGGNPLARVKREQYIQGVGARRMVREVAGAKSCRRVVVVPGRVAPKQKGSPQHYLTPSGQPVYHPGAYRRAYGRPVYVSSTVRVEVGRDWLLCRGIDPALVND